MQDTLAILLDRLLFLDSTNDVAYDRYFEILGEMDFTQEEAEKICRENALKMIGKV